MAKEDVTAGGPSEVAAMLPMLLQGTTVVEFGRFVTAPYAARLLADVGADVIKLEDLRGDPFRSFGADPALSAQFLALNRNKRSIAVDPKSEEGIVFIHKLLASADVFIENSRPGSMKRIGLDYETLREINPQLIYCSITGAGETGVYASRPAYDAVGQALSGLASQLIDFENPKVLGPNLSDSLTGMTAAYSILAALVSKGQTGEGQRIEVDMISSGLAILGGEAQIYFETGEVPGPNTRPSNSSSFVVPCSDGKLVSIHLSSVPKFWEGLCLALDSSELTNDERFSERSGRVGNYGELQAEISRVMGPESSSYWLDRFDKYDVPSARVHTIDDTIEDKDLEPLHLRQVIRGASRPVSTVAIPCQFDNVASAAMTAPPTLGQDTADVMRGAGYSESAIEDFAEREVIR